MKNLFFMILALTLLQISPPRVGAQHPEIGITVVLSGALMFGPYFNYWIDGHQVAEASILAAWEEEFVLPFAFNAGYGCYFGSKKWRPALTLQYSLLKAPESSLKSALTLLPGVQCRWKDHHDIRFSLWITSFLGREKITPWRVMPLGIQVNYGYKFN